jgi:hypothetical protein
MIFWVNHVFALEVGLSKEYIEELDRLSYLELELTLIEKEISREEYRDQNWDTSWLDIYIKEVKTRLSKFPEDKKPNCLTIQNKISELSAELKKAREEVKPYLGAKGGHLLAKLNYGCAKIARLEDQINRLKEICRSKTGITA